MDDQGKVSLQPDGVNRWNLTSEGTKTGHGGALASQFFHYMSHNSFVIFPGRFGFTYTGSGGWSSIARVGHINFGESSGALTQVEVPNSKVGKGKFQVNDSHRNKDGSAPSVSMEIESRCKPRQVP